VLDTYGRKYVTPLINSCVKGVEKRGLTPTQVTTVAFVIGLISAIAYYLNFIVLGVILLWLSGLLDAIDGALARKMGMISKWGTLLDITFDRLVEIALLFVVALKCVEARMAIILVLGSIIFSMTVFLTVGALADNNGKKSFRYQAGLAERTEGFVMITLMMVFPTHIMTLALIFMFAIIITALQRLIEAKRLFEMK